MINSERALILAPRGRDGAVAETLLADAGRQAEARNTIAELVAAMIEGAGLAIITSEALQYADVSALKNWTDEQAPWSDFPFVILSQRAGGAEQTALMAQLQVALGNVIVLERPFHPSALLNVVDNALRGRRRQYQSRRYLDDVREGEQRLQTALLAGRMGSWELRIDELLLTGSDQFRACFGRRPDEPLLFADLIEAVVLSDQTRVQRAFDDATRTGADLVLEYRVHWPDGSEHWVDTRARVLLDRYGQPHTVVGVASDISARKAAEAEREKLLAAVAAERERTQQALRGERALSGLLLTSVPAGIVAYDTELRVTIWNPVMERIFGLPAPAVLGRPLARVIGDGQTEAIDHRLRDALVGISGPIEEIEMTTLTSGNVVLESQHAPLRGGDGEIVGGAAFFREMTERRRAEEQLRQAQKMETIGQLTGGVAHDFNNLLAAIQGNLELLRKRLPDDPQIQRFIDGALQGAQRGASLTSRLLAFARRQDLKPEPTDLGGLLEGMRGLMERSIGPLVAIELDIAPDLPPAKIDANQLELAILNLAVNARDAMPEGGRLALRLVEEDGQKSGLGLKGRFLKLSVSDTGIGMDETTLASAIEPFFSTKELGKGTGLGLSMVHGLAVQLGGALQLKSKLGEGTTAELWLPVSATPVMEVLKMEPEVIVTPQASVILVVDDDALINMNTVDMVQDLGHTVLEAYSGKEALAILDSGKRIDALITDYAMPGMTGVELANRARERFPDLPILLATGYADLPSGTTTDLPRLAKPYQQADLATQISRLLAGRVAPVA
ncbi:hybrid sensor histidine kinase/response regulator [Devosia sp. SL43]|uniref:hybrid sensor histidine kinase/response regulator n=1 Tax=Devosia sp. SL43 TaxID=2806348 RepID=UPI001F24BEE9|nr:PAS domain-containing protein [Devosia sp. SL43]UJW84727.1 PAS domain-containing protein [Devosia sp. SL43]